MTKLGCLLMMGCVALTFAVGCGEGIALDPSPRQTPDTRAGGDGGDAAATDADAIDGFKDVRPDDGETSVADAPARDMDDAGGQRDRGNGDVNADDGDPDAARDATIDARGDFSVDSAGDASLDSG